MGIYLHSSFSFTVKKEWNRMLDYIESIFIEITRPNKRNIVIGSIYRPPGGDHKTLELFNSEMSSILKSINKDKKKTVLIAGDFNLDLIKHGTHRPTSDFLDNMMSVSFSPTINLPTRITDTTSTLLDNIFVNISSDNFDSAIICNDISDHLPVAIHVKTSMPDNNKRINNVTPINRCCTQDALIKFNNALCHQSWDNVNTLTHITGDVNEAYNCFLNIYSKLYNESFPLKSARVHRKNTPKNEWMTTGLLKSCKKRSALYKKYIKSKSTYDRDKYIKYRNKLKSILSKAQKDYYHDRLKSIHGNMRETWNLLNSVIKYSPKNDDIAYLTVDGIQIENNTQMANKLNEYFTNIGDKLSSQIPPTTNNFNNYLKGNYANSISLYPVDAWEIVSIVDNLQNKCSRGYDNIPVNIMKQSIINIATPLSDIINLSMCTGIFPDSLKIAKVRPIFKGGDKDALCNYRPISVLPSFSKIFEKVIYKRLMEYISSKSILNNNQYGFRKNHSTYMAILDMHEKISAAIDNNEYSIGIFIDLAKAFDTIDHDILIAKLQHYGVRGVALSWFYSYLHDRKQYVYVNDASSCLNNVTRGIPQGSILGPLLFILYVNDIVNSSTLLNFILFADDTNLFHSGQNLATLTHAVNGELIKVSNWFRSNKLSLNVKKTNYIIFGKKRRKLNCNVKIAIDTNIIEETQSVKFLGVLLDSGLTWKNHIDYVKSKIARGLGVMHRVRTFLPLKTLIVLYYSLIYPYLQYCNIIWGAAKANTIDKLYIMQKRAIKLCTNSKRTTHSDPLFAKLGMLKLSEINKYQTALFLFKIKHNMLPSCCLSYVSIANNDRIHATRHNSFFVLNRYRTDIRMNAISIRGPRLWETLPNNIQNSQVIMEFERLLKSFYLQTYSQCTPSNC